MNTNDAIKILKDNGLKYTKKREDMINIFVNEDKYINAKYIQQQLTMIIQVYLLILFIVIFIFLKI